VPAEGLTLAGNGHWSADQKPTRCPLFVPESLRNDTKSFSGAARRRRCRCYLRSYHGQQGPTIHVSIQSILRSPTGVISCCYKLSLTHLMIFPTQILRLGAAPGGTGRWSATDLATLAGTGALQCRNSIDTGLALGTQCRCDVRHWPLKCRLNSDTPGPSSALSASWSTM
jgi:hypothetical protein